MLRSVGMALLFLFAAVHGQSLLSADFEEADTGAYAFSQVQKDWPGVTWQNGLAEGRGGIVTGDSAQGKSLRVVYPKGSVGPAEGGVQWRAFLTGSHDTVTMAYRVRFGSDFDFVKGGKLPGLCGSKCNTGGDVPSDTDGWSARLMWRDSVGRAVQYLYFPGQPGTYGLDLPWNVDGKNCLFGRGVWHEVRTRVVLNTPRRGADSALHDGRVTSWFDGALALDSGGFLFRGVDTMHVNHFYVSTFHGGNDVTWAPSRDVSALFDDFTIMAGSVPPTAIAPLVGRPLSRWHLSFCGSAMELVPAAPSGALLELRDLSGRLLARTPANGSFAVSNELAAWRLCRADGVLLDAGLAIAVR
jgi:hypothetical protein